MGVFKTLAPHGVVVISRNDSQHGFALGIHTVFHVVFFSFTKKHSFSEVFLF